jgi:hypothetical protein
MKKQIVACVVAVAAVVGLSACSSVSNQPDQMALHYEDGAYSSKKFKDCVPASKRVYNGPGDKYYQYPTGQRTFDFTGDADSEAKPITVTAKGQNVDGVASGVAAVLVPGVLTFNMNTQCAVVRQFHEQIGRKYQAWWGGSDFVDADDNKNQVPDGWEQVLRFYFGNALKNVTQNIGSQYTYNELRSDASRRTALQAEVEKALPAEVDRLLGSNRANGADYFTNIQVTFNQPTLADKRLDDAITDAQSKVAAAQSRKLEADAQAKAAEAQVAVADAEAKSLAAKVRVLGPEEYNKNLAIEKGINPYPNPVVAGGNNK